MNSHFDCVKMLQELVESVYWYDQVDIPPWKHIATEEASKGRERMYQAARRIALKCDETLSDEDIDTIFGWEPE